MHTQHMASLGLGSFPPQVVAFCSKGNAKVHRYSLNEHPALVSCISNLHLPVGTDLLRNKGSPNKSRESKAAE